jgi:hypothetical protein
MTSLKSRKQILVAQSELNRAQAFEDLIGLTEEVGAFADRAKSFGSLVSAAAVVVAGLATLRRGKSVDGDAKPSWLRKILKGAGLISTLWLAFRSQAREGNDK